MNKNFHHVITAVPARSDVDMEDFEPYFPSLKRGFNNHTVKNNPKEIDDIYLSEDVDNGIVFDFWSEKKLPSGRDEYYGAAEPPVRCGESHLSGLTEPPHFVY